MFVCQTCRKTLNVDQAQAVDESSLFSFDQDDVLSLSASEDGVSASDLEAFRHKQKQAIATLGESFILLDEATAEDTTALEIKTAAAAAVKDDGQGYTVRSGMRTNLDSKINALTTIFELISDKTQLDHPLCLSCSELVITNLKKKVDSAKQEKDTYQQVLSELPVAKTTDASDERKLAKAEEDEKKLLSKLKTLRNQRLTLQKQLQQMQEESATLDAFEARLWRDSQEFDLSLSQISKEQNSLKQAVQTDKVLLTRLKRINVYDDAFHISHDGHFATINGFRLGRLQSQEIEWVEMNAGFGQVVLLLHTLSHQVGCQITKYKLIPMGSFSKIAKAADPLTAYELYGSSDLSLGRLFWYRRFDTALSWLLESVKELCEFAQKADANLKFTYPIKNDTIGGISVKLQFNQDEKWTTALKYLLTTLKKLLIWSSRYN